MRDQPWYHHVSIEAQRRGLWSNLAVCTRLVQATAFTFRSISPTDHFGVLELPDVRSGGSVSAARVEDFGSRGGRFPSLPPCTEGNYAQTARFAKSHERPIAAVHDHLRMLQCGPSKRPLVHGAAFLATNTSVCGLCYRSLPVPRSPSGQIAARSKGDRTRLSAYLERCHSRK